MPAQLEPWSLRDGTALEHGWNYPVRPPHEGPLVVRLAFDTAHTLEPHIDSIRLLADRQVASTYTGLRAWDSTGKDLPSWMSVECGDRCLGRLSVDDRLAVYPITVDPWIESARLNDLIPDVGFLAEKDLGVGITGLILPEDDFGTRPQRLHFFERTEAGDFDVYTWQAPTRYDVHTFGTNVLANGDDVFLSTGNGTQGFNPIFFAQRQPVGHVEVVQEIEAVRAGFGMSIATQGDRLFVGSGAWAFGDHNGGVDVYARGVDGLWMHESSHDDGEPGDYFGGMIAVSGDRMVTTSSTELYTYDLSSGAPILVDVGPRPGPRAFPVRGLALEGDWLTHADTHLTLYQWVGGEWVTRFSEADSMAMMWPSPLFDLHDIILGSAPEEWFVATQQGFDDRCFVSRFWLDESLTFQSEVQFVVPSGCGRLMRFDDDLVVTLIEKSNISGGDYDGVAVYSVAEPPTVVSDPLVVDEGGTAALSLALSATDPDSDVSTVRWRFDSPPAHGTLYDVDGLEVPWGSQFDLATTAYVHDGSETLSDSLEVIACDTSDLCSPLATLNIEVLPVNDPPVAAPDAFTVLEGGTLEIDLLANDTDVDSELLPIDVQQGQLPLNGSMLVAEVLQFEHDGAEVLSDTFSYLACDPDGACDEAWVDVVVIPTNDAPTGVADTAAIDEGGTVHIDVLANDLDPDSPLNYNAVTLVSTPASALVVVVTDGLLVTHDGSEPTADGFVYRVCDPEGLCGDADVVLQVLGVNDPPQAVPDAIAVNEGAETTFDPRTNDLDPDDAVADLSMVIQTPPVAGEASVVGGNVRYVHDGDEGASDVFTVQVCDPAGACSDSVVTVTVAPIDDAPTANDDAAVVPEGGRGWVAVLANDVDADSVLSDVRIVDPPAHGTATVVAGAVEVVHDGSETVSDGFRYEVCDGAGSCSQAEVLLTIAPQDDVPLVSDDTYSGPSPIEVDAKSGVLANDTDTDSSMSATLVDGPQHGELALNRDGSFIYEAERGYAGSDRFFYEVDGVTGAVWLEVEKSGCGCAASGPMATGWLGALLALCVVRRRGY